MVGFMEVRGKTQQQHSKSKEQHCKTIGKLHEKHRKIISKAWGTKGK